jgi:L-threonylcarbamoyladenylate synthase
VTRQEAPYATQIRRYGEGAVAEAARLILDGLAVALPTETVYGLAADATNEAAVARVFEAKGRPAFNPLIVHVGGVEQADELAKVPDAAKSIATLYWPGAVTMVVPRRANSRIAPSATAGLRTVALRCPAHRAIRDVLAACGRPLAAPSANASGGISSTTAEHVLRSLGGRIPLILDDGPTEHGIESTIIGFDEDRITLLRPGPVDFAELAAAAQLSKGKAPGGVQAPGQLASHYAPSKPLRLKATTAAPDEWLIGFGSVKGDDSLSAKGDLGEAAARLFEALHRADASGRAAIAVAPVPETGVGLAINDRLRRAAAPRPIL